MVHLAAQLAPPPLLSQVPQARAARWRSTLKQPAERASWVCGGGEVCVLTRDRPGRPAGAVRSSRARGNVFWGVWWRVCVCVDVESTLERQLPAGGGRAEVLQAPSAASLPSQLHVPLRRTPPVRALFCLARLLALTAAIPHQPRMRSSPATHALHCMHVSLPQPVLGLACEQPLLEQILVVRIGPGTCVVSKRAGGGGERAWWEQLRAAAAAGIPS